MTASWVRSHAREEAGSSTELCSFYETLEQQGTRVSYMSVTRKLHVEPLEQLLREV